MDIFKFRNDLITNYSNYVRSFFEIRDEEIAAKVSEQFDKGMLWPEVLIQLNPNFKPGESAAALADSGTLHKGCAEVFQRRAEDGTSTGSLTFHTHQVEAIKAAAQGENYVLTTGTGSGKSLCYIVPIVDHVLRTGSGKGIKAIIVYPMNALANSQQGELEKFLDPHKTGNPPVTFKRYTGQEGSEARDEILKNPPDILLTNYVMLELILTRPREKGLVKSASDLRFLVLDELHTYRGRQGADVAMLVRRLKNSINAPNLMCVGTSATMGGTGQDQQKVVSEVASLIFGQEVNAENVIGETLEPVSDINPPSAEDLKAVLSPVSIPSPEDPPAFTQHALCRWVERTFGLREEAGKLVRAQALPVAGEAGAGTLLAKATGMDVEPCEEAIRQTLLAGFACHHPKTSRPLFAFRLHQFISRGGSVYASLETPGTRHITLEGQKYVPKDRNKLLFPLVFCRECGQDYYPVARHPDPEGTHFSTRDIGEREFDNKDTEAGFLLIDPKLQWPEDDPEAQVDYVPEEWTEHHGESRRIKRERRKDLPDTLFVDGLAKSCQDDEGHQVTFFSAPFRFCPCCRVSYDFRQRSDIAKLTSLGTEGRSTATTILSLFTLLGLENEHVAEKARKLLSFTDNRQDAALQAGHYNDFIEVGLLRSALYKALEEAGSEGVEAKELTSAVFKSLNLPFSDYASDPGVRGGAKRRVESTLRDVISYRIYRDLKRGWRVIMPNLEQAGLLKLEYPDLEDLSTDEEVWSGSHVVLVAATPEERANVCQTLLDFMRRGLAIKVNSLDSIEQEKLSSSSYSNLKHPWALGEDEKLEHAAVLFPRSRVQRDTQDNIFVAAMSGYGLYLRRQKTFANIDTPLNKQDTEQVIREILVAMSRYGLVEVVEGDPKDEAPGYQLQPEAMIWKAGDGTSPFHDIIRMPGLPTDGGKTNDFFVKFYRRIAQKALGTEALEHTAQVRSDEREVREERFRRGSLPASEGERKGLPILYCSPTMELGIDISELNVVNMRNVPPTPANYAQRSGRAGRSGSPALVSTYCSTMSAHDQFFFARPKQMVSGVVTAPRIEVANEDLIRAHVYAIWLACSHLDLKSTMPELLEADGDSPSLVLRSSVADALNNQGARKEAKRRANEVLLTILPQLEGADWWDDQWVDGAVDAVAQEFEKACQRWRSLYKAAQRQFDESARIIKDASRSPHDKRRATALMNEAKNQMALLTQQASSSSIMHSDFYTYRYFASEGFLPGYSFPRLPLSAYIRAEKRKGDHSEYLSRARFIAISEFGPQAMVYHAGNKYQITRSLIPLSEESVAEGGLQKQKLKLCPSCGFLHLGQVVETQNNCDHCQASLASARDNLFRMENVSTQKRMRISSDEEERFKLGYEIISGVRFAQRDKNLSFTTGAVLAEDGTELFQLYYGASATIWRINLGWRRRKQGDPDGFLIDVESGRWQSNTQAQEANNQADEDAELSRPERVVPYVEDRRNALLIEPLFHADETVMASLQAALKQGIQIEFQLEDSELAAEPLPSEAQRNRILMFESAEGGAGVLRRLIMEKDAIARVAKTALEIAHYELDGTDNRHAKGMEEDCEAACYHCLLSYTNQRDHSLIYRDRIKDLLMQLTGATAETSGSQKSRADHLKDLFALCESSLEREWLEELEQRSLRLPSHAQHYLEDFKTRPDFYFHEESVVIYIDGRHHDDPDRAARDQEQEEALEAGGFRIIRFRYDQDWNVVFEQYKFLFGKED